MKIPYLKRVVLAGGVSWLALCGPAFATLQEALDALKEQDYIFAMEEFTRLADKEENAEARYYIGRMYEQGTGVQQDELKALEFYQQAADQGSASAALKVGNAYYNGKGKEKDYKEAFKWYKKAADQNNYPAQYNLGLMLEEGLGVKEDILKSFEYYKKSADQGYAPAQMALGRMYLKGLGTPQDFSQAIFWYKLALNEKADAKAGGFVLPDCSGFLPCIWLAVCYDKLGEYERAAAYNALAGQYKPSDKSYLHNKLYFENLLKSKGKNL